MTPLISVVLALEEGRTTVLFPSARDSTGLTLAHVAGAFVMASVATSVTWDHFYFWVVPEARSVVILSLAAYAIAAIATARMASLPRSAPLGAILIGTTV